MIFSLFRIFVAKISVSLPKKNLMNKDLPVIQFITSLITATVSPERVILFGSYSRGDNTPASDIDILIVQKNLKNERALTGKLYKKLLKEKITTPVDLLAVDYDKYQRLKNETGYIYKTIAKEGQVLFEKK
jgi:predicted nucleotidyltransferase